MAALYGYFDESGKAHQHDVVVFSGFISTWERWESLGEEWRRLLREFNLASLKFSEQKRRTSVLKKFIHLIRTEIEFGISVAVKVDAFKALPEHIKKELGGDPHYLAFKCVVMAMITRVRVEPGTTINFTCDEDEGTTRHCFDWYKDFKRESDEVRSKLISFCIADDVYFPQIQAADVFAGIARAEAELHLLKRDYDFKDLFGEITKRDQFGRLRFATLFCDDDALRQIADEWPETVNRLGHAE